LTKRVSGFYPLKQACVTGRLQAACVPSEHPWQPAKHFKTNKENTSRPTKKLAKRLQFIKVIFNWTRA